MEQIKNWVDQYADDLYRWATFKISDHAVAEDLVQDTFLAAVKGYSGFQGKSNPKTWLFSILNNKIVDYYRKQFKNREHHNDTQERLSQQLTDGFFDNEDMWKVEKRPQEWIVEEEHLLDNHEFRGVLKNCLEELPKKWHAAVQLKYLDEKDGHSICQELDITPTNFWQIIRRAKLQLRECIETNWFKEN
ncbi:MAG: sigma-70 family RNA polymerase sigma factor [Bacteroidetes bacterium]|jgi:RNA polymerase sigma-70 factor (ECF subfamily)|nr:sigma-70 family RNA polymerase sigma factor [Bacteroidota bacterium]